MQHIDNFGRLNNNTLDDEKFSYLTNSLRKELILPTFGLDGLVLAVQIAMKRTRAPYQVKLSRREPFIISCLKEQLRDLYIRSQQYIY